MQKIIIVALCVCIFGCHAGKDTAGEDKSCPTTGKVVDYSGVLDGCRFLIELENGDRLNPVEVTVEGFQFRDGQKIRFGYEKLEDQMSVCMAESAFVRITCIHEMESSTTYTGDHNCVDTRNPFEVEWMNKAIDHHNPNQVVKYPFEGEWAYLFKGIPDSYLYNCRGQFICETTGDVTDKCHIAYLNNLENGEIIWQGEGIWD
ncbi:MAG: hypothetical protein D6714_16240 [Bacteroidetes bacterium]|nr:MAG: hypothetical protein D6714_16240 [Bacteroidota bacterium]